MGWDGIEAKHGRKPTRPMKPNTIEKPNRSEKPNRRDRPNRPQKPNRTTPILQDFNHFGWNEME